jgi:type I restriction enzyme, S subunit
MGSTQVPEGYKQTEGGVIPEDWDVKELASIIISGPKNGYSGQTGGDSIGTPTLRLTATSSGYIIINDETVKRLSETIDPNSDLFLQPGDVLIQRSNTYELVGTTAIFNGPSRTYIYPDLMMRLRFQDQLAAHWFWKYANSVNGRRFFLSIAAGSSGSMPKISGAKLRRMKIPFPSKEEQRSIAQALSDVDALIASLDKLIAKKCHLKTATMQQLLTGKMRSPGFGKGKWSRHQLGDVVEKIVGGGTPSRANPDFWDGNIPWATVKDFSSFDPFCTQEYITKEGLSNSASNLIPRGTLITSTRMALGKAVIYKVDVAINQDLKAIFPNQNIDCLYLYYWFESQSEYIDSLGGGSTVKGISVVDLKSIWLFKPPLEEQKSYVYLWCME